MEELPPVNFSIFISVTSLNKIIKAFLNLLFSEGFCLHLSIEPVF